MCNLGTSYLFPERLFGLLCAVHHLLHYHGLAGMTMGYLGDIAIETLPNDLTNVKVGEAETPAVEGTQENTLHSFFFFKIPNQTDLV